MRSFSYYWKEGFRNFFAHGFMSFAAILIMVACLLMTGTTALLAHNINLNIVDLQKSSEVVAFIDEDLTTREAKALESDFRKIDNIDTITFQSRDEALETYRITLGDDAAILDTFDDSNNPLRNAFRVTLKDPLLTEETLQKIEGIGGVANIRADEAIVERLVQVQRMFNVLTLAMLIILTVISIFIISNTVKLGMFARREEISIQKMVGATNWFIRWPFVVEGLIIGLVSAGVAFFAEMAAYREIANVVSNIPSITMLPFGDLRWLVLGGFAIAGVVFGIGGSVTSIRKFMNV